MYGYQVKSIDDPLIAAADRAFLLANGLLTPSASIINILPFLGRIPPWLSGPMKSRKVAAEARQLLEYMQESMLDFVKASIVCIQPKTRCCKLELDLTTCLCRKVGLLSLHS